MFLKYYFNVIWLVTRRLWAVHRINRIPKKGLKWPMVNVKKMQPFCYSVPLRCFKLVWPLTTAILIECVLNVCMVCFESLHWKMCFSSAFIASGWLIVTSKCVCARVCACCNWRPFINHRVLWFHHKVSTYYDWARSKFKDRFSFLQIRLFCLTHIACYWPIHCTSRYKVQASKTTEKRGEKDNSMNAKTSLENINVSSVVCLFCFVQ